MSNEISLCILARDEEHCIGTLISSLKNEVSEVLVIDDHSLDKTADLAIAAGARVIPLPFNLYDHGFAEAANWMISCASSTWVLIVDADELVTEGQYLSSLVRTFDATTWALPRRKWENWTLQVREEYEAYPDWQVRLINKQALKGPWFSGEMHVRFQYPEKVRRAFRGPHIEHLQHELRTTAKALHRADLYSNLATRQGVAIDGGSPLVK